jgi:DNA-binding SARP family transcriptional activator
LLSRAQATFSPEAWSILIRGAASLLEEAGLTEAAISLLHEAGDWDRIILLILKHAPPMIAQGRSHPLEEWVRFIPKDITENNAWLLYWMGACNLHFNPFQSRSYFEKAFDKFRFQENAAGTFLAWSGIIDSIWLDFSDFKQFDKWIPIFEELISDFKEIPSEEIAARAANSMFIALAMRQPQHPEIEKWSERALSSLDYQMNISAKISALFRQVIYRMFTGDFDKMALPVTLLRQLGQSRDASPTAQIAARLAEACYCRITGFHEKCLNLMHDGLERSRRSGVHFMEYVFLVQGIMSGLSKNDAPTVENLLEKMESLLSRLHPWGKSFYHYLRTREALARGDTKQASFHSDQSVKFGTDAGCSLTLWICHVMKAHVMHRLGKDQEAEDHLSLALSIPQSTIRQFVVQMARALFALDLGKEASGLPLLRKAFAIGREGRYFETHVDQPSAMAWLCEKALEAGFEVEYVQELIRRRNLLPEKPPLHLENWPWPLKIYTLGRFELLKDGNPIQFSRKAQQKPLTLLKALIAFGGKGIREDRVEDALWPEADGDMAHHSLEMTLHRLRRLIGHEKAIQHQEGRLTLDPRYCWVDAWAFERIAERADASWRQEAIESNLTKAIQSSKKAIDIYRGPFLAGEMVEPWTNSMSERLQSKFLRCVEKLGQHWEKAGHWEKAVECYQQGLEIDERIEEFYQHLIVAYHRLGQFTKARSVYNRKKTLSASSGIDPSPKTEAIYQEILKQEGKKRILKTKDQ